MEARFPADVASALAKAGWFPDRKRLPMAEAWAARLSGYVSPEGHRHTVFPAALEAWAEFGEIAVDLDGPGIEVARTPFAIDPLRGLHQPRTLADLGRSLELPVAPLGEERDGAALLAIDAVGRVYSLDHAGEWFLGHSMDQALTTLINGLRAERLRFLTDAM
ncbi:SUKH-3 domain-containing protein [Streptacidiphilus jiangxiensis]|uniref:SUKH-3 immunity protein n=1 Tax=Streptacidiphilus jiangxiensis TaxID=235985 RepID=A0A1H7FF05_STRJI|nr:SUKH-3 domain-containing protein [Streptacidiphilus jiangxiensis]SEK24549.1 SUKH-3 immunity protein [Streptacidiphilus jiangxiensis]